MPALTQSAPGIARELTARAVRTVCESKLSPPVTAEFPLSGAAAAQTVMGGTRPPADCCCVSPKSDADQA
ncbi:hypothetical protein San01_12570 [Streptomyces angustmyceticus]|uniref:Uncharacterized protein n=1 Tax=Streptomyces angustmyceticus TaxID=285578 RepID=A0A5J4LB99_9ACTN|nr:hypothetical protein San01_12570 [Streptomyces angustmyceticus]